LNNQLKNKENLCSKASTRIKSNADYLIREINNHSDELRKDDLVILALEGLQQVNLNH
jgi:transcriptional antiterminator Rof (Rho-off)